MTLLRLAGPLQPKCEANLFQMPPEQKRSDKHPDMQWVCFWGGSFSRYPSSLLTLLYTQEILYLFFYAYHSNQSKFLNYPQFCRIRLSIFMGSKSDLAYTCYILQFLTLPEKTRKSLCCFHALLLSALRYRHPACKSMVRDLLWLSPSLKVSILKPFFKHHSQPDS